MHATNNLTTTLSVPTDALFYIVCTLFARTCFVVFAIFRELTTITVKLPEDGDYAEICRKKINNKVHKI